MFIKRIVLEGVEGDVEISRTEGGAVVAANDVETEVRSIDTREDRYAVAHAATEVLCGTTARGTLNATNSMVHEVLDLIDRIAGC
ncbi:MAG: hypothetical protein ACF8R9_13450 [Phycisphaerales bacterium JB054]